MPTGNAGEYFLTGKLLRCGFDAQLADRNTQGYDILVGRSTHQALRKLQVKSARIAPWYVNQNQFKGDMLEMVTIYVLVGVTTDAKSVRHFIARNKDLASKVDSPENWTQSAFMSQNSLLPFEDKWESVLT